MITRQPTFKDYSKLGEQVGADLVAQWMFHCKENPNCISLVTLEKKKVVAVFLGEYNPSTEVIESRLFVFPEDKPEVGKFILNKIVKHFTDQSKPVQKVVEVKIENLWSNDEDDREVQVS